MKEEFKVHTRKNTTETRYKGDKYHRKDSQIGKGVLCSIENEAKEVKMKKIRSATKDADKCGEYEKYQDNQSRRHEEIRGKAKYTTRCWVDTQTDEEIGRNEEEEANKKENEQHKKTDEEKSLIYFTFEQFKRKYEEQVQFLKRYEEEERNENKGS